MNVWTDGQLIELLVSAKTDLVMANAKFYSNEELISDWARELYEWFPKSLGEAITLDIGDDGKRELDLCYLEFSLIDKRGIVNLKVNIIHNSESKESYNVEMNIATDIPSVNRFGNSLRQLKSDFIDSIKLNCR